MSPPSIHGGDIFSVKRFPVEGNHLDNFKQQQDQHDGEDQAKPASAVITDPRAHPVATVSETKDQHDENNQQQHVLSFRDI